jgi:hypothetical protein
MKPKLCAAGVTLRDQVNERFKDRDTSSDGWLGDSAHSQRPSDHNPFGPSAVVRAIDLDRDLSGKPKPDLMPYLADQIRLCAKKDKRVKYVIFERKIASAKSLWRWRTYRGINPHSKHCHVSFTEAGDNDPRPFDIPLLENK